MNTDSNDSADQAWARVTMESVVNQDFRFVVSPRLRARGERLKGLPLLSGCSFLNGADPILNLATRGGQQGRATLNALKDLQCPTRTS